MEKVTVEDVEPLAPSDENIPEGAMAESIGGARPLSEPLNATELSINHYELAPGESFAHSSHQHSNQEELFYVQSGTVTFETEHEDLTVDAGEILRVPPETFQLGTNHGDERVTALALGAPGEYEEKPAISSIAKNVMSALRKFSNTWTVRTNSFLAVSTAIPKLIESRTSTTSTEIESFDCATALFSVFQSRDIGKIASS